MRIWEHDPYSDGHVAVVLRGSTQGGRCVDGQARAEPPCRARESLVFVDAPFDTSVGRLFER